MNNLKQLIAENPDYLKSGIPTQLIQQMFSQKAQPNVMQPKVTNNRVLNVCYDFVIIFNFTYGVRYSSRKCNNTLLSNLHQVNQIDEEEGEEEEMGVAETYADYWPSKCKY